MPVSAETLRLLMDAGLAGDDLLRIVESIDRTSPKERTANAERQARFRAKRKGESVTDNVTSNVTQSVTEVTPLARVEDNLQTKNSTEDKKQDTRRNGLADFKAILRNDLGDERLEAFIAARRAKRAAFTGHAANLFLADAAAVSMTPAAAADMCISRSWITVKPEYLIDRNKRSTGPPDKPRNAGELAMMRLNGTYPHEPPGKTTGRLDIGDGRRQVEDAGDVLRPAFGAKHVS